MSASLNIKTYSEHWMRLFEKFQTNPQENYVVPCKTKKEAFKVRLEWYRARAALQREEEKMDVVTYMEYGHPNLNRKECLVKQTENGRFEVHFAYKEDSSVAQLLAASFEAEGEAQ